MAELLTMALFTAQLIVCVLLGLPVIWALVIGFFIFFAYGLKKGHSAGSLISMAKKGVMTSKNILIIFMLIGMLTALWRACGTIPVIVCYSATLIKPSVVVLASFLLTMLVSVLTGTSFGTVATMGVICMSIARAMNVNPVLAGGAIVSGCFFGDRCSPVSSSAALVCSLTDTDIYDNIKGMVRTAMVPTVLTCVLYGVLGFFSKSGGEVPDMTAIYTREFTLHWILVLPAAAILILAAVRMGVKRIMIVSILISMALCALVQKMSIPEILKAMALGYRAADPELSAMVNGGGISSMIMTSLIVGLSSSYAGIFEGTGLLISMKKYISSMSGRITPFGSIFVVSVATCLISCNQTLATILTHQLCAEEEPDKQKMALALENTVILMAPLVPWSIAGAVLLTTLSVPNTSLFTSFYLYLVPLWNLLVELLKGKGGLQKNRI